MKFPRKAKLTKNDYIDLIDKLLAIHDIRIGLEVIEYLQSKRTALFDENDILLKKGSEKLNELANLADEEFNIENMERINKLKNEYNKIESKMKENDKKIKALNIED